MSDLACNVITIPLNVCRASVYELLVMLGVYVRRYSAMLDEVLANMHVCRIGD